jgi:hypothetical protein
MLKNILHVEIKEIPATTIPVSLKVEIFLFYI